MKVPERYELEIIKNAATKYLLDRPITVSEAWFLAVTDWLYSKQKLQKEPYVKPD